MALTPELQAVGVVRVQGKDNGKLVCLMKDGSIQHLADEAPAAAVASVVFNVDDAEAKAVIEDLNSQIEDLTKSLKEAEEKLNPLQDALDKSEAESSKVKAELEKVKANFETSAKVASDQAEEIKKLKAEIATLKKTK